VLIGEMRRYALGEGYDRQPMPELDSEAIDFRVASESFAPLRKLTRGDLATLRLTTPYQGRRTRRLTMAVHSWRVPATMRLWCGD